MLLKETVKSSVANLRCLSRIPDPDFLAIPDPGSRIQKPQQKRGEKNNFFAIPFFVATNFTKLKNYFIFEMLKKNIWLSFQRIIELFTQTFVTKL
jgi:hypothetical protein